MLTKEKAAEALVELPDEFSLDELVDRLLFVQKVAEGLRQSEADEVYSTDKARDLLNRWPN
jgi:hypothetical protein